MHVRSVCLVKLFLKREFARIFYTMSNVLLDYTESEKDLGIIMNSTLNFNEQAESLYAKANLWKNITRNQIRNREL